MYQVSFSKVSEIRMGSPYNAADLQISGDFVPDLPLEEFQDRAATRSDGQVCFLVQWSYVKNDPGFIVWKLSELTKTAQTSQRIEGCCSSIRVEAGKVWVSVFRFPNRNHLPLELTEFGTDNSGTFSYFSS